MRNIFLTKAAYDLLFDHSIAGGAMPTKPQATGSIASRIPTQPLPLLEDPNMPANHILAVSHPQRAYSTAKANSIRVTVPATQSSNTTKNGASTSSTPDPPAIKVPKLEAPTGTVCDSSDDDQ